MRAGYLFFDYSTSNEMLRAADPYRRRRRSGHRRGRQVLRIIASLRSLR